MKQPDILIINGRLIDPANNIDQISHLFIRNGMISSLDADPGQAADHVIDAREQIVCPGLVDLRARFREPGQEHKATLASEALAATRSGITTACCPPDTFPIIDTPAVADLIQTRAASTGLINLLPLGALSQQLQGQQLAEMASLKDAGCVGVSNAEHSIDNAVIMRRAMEYATTYGLRVHIHPQDQQLAAEGCVHEGIISTRLGLPGIPAAAEIIATARDIALAAQTGAAIHFCGMSDATAVTHIGRARHDGIKVTADVCAHQLFLSEHDVADFDASCHLSPPLRSTGDRDALRQALANGVIDIICSDHQPHDADAKRAPFPSTETGISSLETLLPLTLALVQEGVLAISDALACITSKPARILGLDCGTLGIGRRADICIFDPEAFWTLDADSMVSSGHNTPFNDHELVGQVNCTLLAGTITYHRQKSSK